MITKMKKVMLITHNDFAELDGDLSMLGKLGMVHITPFQPAEDESIKRVDARIRQMQMAIEILEAAAQETGGSQATKMADSGEAAALKDYDRMERGDVQLMQEVLETDMQRLEHKRQLLKHRDDLRFCQHWGRVRAGELAELHEVGIYITAYEAERRELKNIAALEGVHVVGQEDGKLQLVLVSESPEARLNYEERHAPEDSFEELSRLADESSVQLQEAEAKLMQLAPKAELLREGLAERMRRKTIRDVQFSGQVIDGQVRCWKGYLPQGDVEAFVEAAEVYQWGYVIEDPTEEDAEEVPTLIRSPRWADRIRPVMNFMGLVPGYKEIDVSRIFMLFFTFFAGILVGDAGYGLIFLLLTLVVHGRMKFRKKVEIELFYSLSFSIMVWGVLTGTYFGSEAIADLPFLSRLKVEKIASFGGDNLMVQKVMFFIGAVHLSIGHLQLALKYSNSVRAIAQLGWVAIAWGLYLIVNQMVLGMDAPGIMLWLFIGGAALIALFSNPGKNFFKGVLNSLGSLPLSVISGFSDIISYIRLYAVGLSTVLMASSFNDMAIGDGITTVAAYIGAVLVLILGHGLNMILAGMAVIVHGVRLNMLEYAGHANVEFSGTEYTPFSLNKTDSHKKNN